MLPGWHREGTPSPGKDRALPTRSPGDPADPDPSRARWTFIPRLRKLRAGHGCTQKNNREPFLVWPQSALLPSSHFQWEISDYFGDPGGSLVLPPPGLAMAARAASPPLLLAQEWFWVGIATGPSLLPGFVCSLGGQRVLQPRSAAIHNNLVYCGFLCSPPARPGAGAGAGPGASSTICV